MANNNNNNNNNKKNQQQQTDISGLFSDFLKLCYDIDHEPKYSEKTSILAKNFKVWKGDVYLLCKLLLCKNDLRKYNIREKSAVKILSRYFNAPYQEMLSDLELGDMPETARKFYVKYGTPVAKSNITIKQVDAFLQELAAVRAEDAQYNVFSKFLPKVTADDLKMLMKIIDHDLKINIGPKYVLGALHPDAFTAYRNSNNLELIVERVMNQEAMEKKDGGGLFSDLGIDGNNNNSNNNNGDSKSDAGGGGGFLTGLTLMIPVKPMLAKACHGMNEVISRCPNGMYSEIKYDGERIQIHKKGNEFKCFSRNLKPLPDWKVEQVKEFIPKATKADTIILDGEILLMDTKNHKPLPFGTLGVHKQSLYKDACVCVFLFDILYINGKVLLNKSLRKRRKIMEKHIKPVKFRVEFSEMTFINKEEDLCLMMTKVMQEGLEGLVIKDIKSIYEPGSRHWIKLKKDYLKGMADSADMVVIGANFGSGSKGGLMSTFLMGVHDPKTNKWKTVCKVGNGHDDDTLKSLQTVFKNKMNKVDRDFTRVPDWLDIHKSVVPDFIIKDPKKSAVWEVVGSEFTQSKKHTAAAISVRFPRVVRIRDDKDWKTATNLQELVDLSQASKADLKISSSKKGKVTKKYKPITTDADESSSSEEDQAGPSSKTNATTSIFSAPSKGNGNDDDDDDDMDDALPAGDAGVAASGTGASGTGASGGDKGKKAKYNQKVKINRPPRILYCGDGKEVQTDIGDKMGTPPRKLEGSKKINYMMGDVTSPSGTYLDENMIICHIADDSGKWSDKGVFAAISQKWEYPEQVFKKHPSVMGDAQVVKISNLNGKGNLYVATLIAQQSRSHKLNLESFVTCLKHLSKFALANNSSVHLPKLKMPNMNWSEIQGLLITYLVGKSVPTYVYTVGRDTGTKGKTAQPIIKKTGQDAGDKQPLVKKRSLDEEGFKSTNKKHKTDISSTTTTTTTSVSSKPDLFLNPFPYDYDGGELDEEEDDDIDEESDHDRFGKGDYDNDEESDEEKENMRSLILDDFVLSQHSSGGTLDWSGVGPKDNKEMEKDEQKENEDSEGSGNMDDTISMDSEELEAITRSASVYASMTTSDSENDSKITKNKNKSNNDNENNNENNNVKQTKIDVKPLKNVRIVFSGFSSEREMELGKKARELGAEISPQWFQIGPLRCSHLICAQHTSVVDNVLMMGGTAYTEKWLLDSYKAKARQPESPYIFNKKQTPSSSNSNSSSSSSSSNNSNSSSNSNSHVPPSSSSVAPPSSSSSSNSSSNSNSSHSVPPPDVPFHKPITTVHLPQIFADLVIYVFGSCDKSTELCSLIAKHGGTVISQINEDVTHILSANGCVEGSLREECPDACVVSPKWAWDSIKKQALLSERPFLIK